MMIIIMLMNVKHHLHCTINTHKQTHYWDAIKLKVDWATQNDLFGYRLIVVHIYGLEPW